MLGLLLCRIAAPAEGVANIDESTRLVSNDADDDEEEEEDAAGDG